MDVGRFDELAKTLGRRAIVAGLLAGAVGARRAAAAPDDDRPAEGLAAVCYCQFRADGAPCRTRRLPHAKAAALVADEGAVWGTCGGQGQRVICGCRPSGNWCGQMRRPYVKAVSMIMSGRATWGHCGPVLMPRDVPIGARDGRRR